MRLLYLLITTTVVYACSNSKFSLAIKSYQKDPKKRNAVHMKPFTLSPLNLKFIEESGFEQAAAFKLSFNFYQSLYNDLKNNLISESIYIEKISKLNCLDTQLVEKYKNWFYLPEVIEDKNYNADLKILVATNRNNDVVLIIDENNNDKFLDDKQMMINRESYDTFLTNNKYTISNIFTKRNDIIINNEIEIKVNQLFVQNSFNNSAKASDFDIWIDYSNYYNAIKNIFLKKYQLKINQLNWPLYNELPTLSLVRYSKKDKIENNYTFLDNYFQIGKKVFVLDSISPQKKIAYFHKSKTKKNISIDEIKDCDEIGDRINSKSKITSQNKELLYFEDYIRAQNDTLLFVDFWASWCLPCRKEMPFLKDLENKFKGQPIKFISISLDTDTSSWIKVSNLEHLNKNNSFLFNKSWQANFVFTNKITSIPRYMLMGKNGKILIQDALKPSDIRLIDSIKFHLQNDK